MLERNWTPGDYSYALRCGLLGAPDGAAEAELNERVHDGPWLARLAGFTVHDRRNDVRGPADKRGAPKPPRPWTSIFGLTVHQTASGHLHADHPRILSVPAHAMIHGDGSITLLHPLPLRIEHGHALNGPTIGVEIDCRADGIEGDPRTFWRSAEETDGWRRDKLKRKVKFVGIKTRDDLRREATDRQLDALVAFSWYAWEAWMAHVPKEQRPHWGVYTHRQGRSDRTSDPGSRIARRIEEQRQAVAWKDVSLEHYGSGRPQPDVWVGRERGVKY